MIAPYIHRCQPADHPFRKAFFSAYSMPSLSRKPAPHICSPLLLILTAPSISGLLTARFILHLRTIAGQDVIKSHVEPDESVVMLRMDFNDGNATQASYASQSRAFGDAEESDEAAAGRTAAGRGEGTRFKFHRLAVLIFALFRSPTCARHSSV